MRGLIAALVVSGACAPAPAAPTGATSSGGEPASIVALAEPAGEGDGEGAGHGLPVASSGSCLTEADRAAIDVSAPTAERFEEALNAIDGPADASGLDPIVRRAAAVRALVLFDSIERDSSDPSEARISAMLAMDVLGTLASGHPACAAEPCVRIGPVLTRHCPVELPADDLTAACPTLALYATRCLGGTP